MPCEVVRTREPSVEAWIVNTGRVCAFGDREWRWSESSSLSIHRRISPPAPLVRRARESDARRNRTATNVWRLPCAWLLAGMVAVAVATVVSASVVRAKRTTYTRPFVVPVATTRACGAWNVASIEHTPPASRGACCATRALSPTSTTVTVLSAPAKQM